MKSSLEVCLGYAVLEYGDYVEGASRVGSGCYTHGPTEMAGQIF